MASESWNRAFRAVIAVAAVALIVSSWYIYVQNIKLRRFATGLLRAREYPYVVTGLKVDILQDSALLQTSPDLSPADRKPVRKLVLVTSDTCGYCARNLPRWKKLLAGLSPRDSQEVWLLTMNTARRTEPLVRLMQAEKLPYRVLAVRDPMLFSLKTGIVGVPMTLVLGRDSSVELICHGQLGDREITIFQDFLSGTGAPGKPFLVSADRRTDSVY
jgi:hypothetical protein